MKTKKTPVQIESSEFVAKAEQLIRHGNMPSLHEMLEIVVETREECQEKILKDRLGAKRVPKVITQHAASTKRIQ
jgi:hypothetical protein